MPEYIKDKSGMPSTALPKFMLDAAGVKINPRGGMTFAFIQAGEAIIAAQAVCSMSENFVKEKGTTLALVRAIEVLHIYKQQQQVVTTVHTDGTVTHTDGTVTPAEPVELPTSMEDFLEEANKWLEQ